MGSDEKKTKTIRLEITIEVPTGITKRESQSEESAILSRVLDVATHRPQDKRITIADAFETVGLTVTDVSHVTIGNETPEFSDAVRVSEAWYRAEVSGCADDVIERLLETASGDREDQLHEYLHEAVDGRQCIIYTAQARMVMAATDSPDAVHDVHGDPSEGVPHTVEQQAFYAMEADVSDRVMARQDEWHPDHMPDADDSDAADDETDE